MKNFFLVMRP